MSNFVEGQLLFTYLHEMPNPENTAGLMKACVTAIDYDTVFASKWWSAVAGHDVRSCRTYDPLVWRRRPSKATGRDGMTLDGETGRSPGNAVVIVGRAGGT